jgi:hypothetical protein
VDETDNAAMPPIRSFNRLSPLDRQTPAPSASTGFPRADAAIAALREQATRWEAEFAWLPKDVGQPGWVRAKIHHMYEVDQLLRNALGSIPRQLGFTPEETAAFQQGLWTELVGPRDVRNTEDMKRIIERHGWLTKSRFGPDIDRRAWLLVQHADLDRPFQREVLALLEPLAATGETNPANFAYLYDRVAVGEGRPQRYGTQGRCMGPGDWDPNPLEDASRVDEWRASVGLPPLAEYEASISEDLC